MSVTDRYTRSNTRLANSVTTELNSNVATGQWRRNAANARLTIAAPASGSGPPYFHYAQHPGPAPGSQLQTRRPCRSTRTPATPGGNQPKVGSSSQPGAVLFRLCRIPASSASPGTTKGAQHPGHQGARCGCGHGDWHMRHQEARTAHYASQHYMRAATPKSYIAARPPAGTGATAGYAWLTCRATSVTPMLPLCHFLTHPATALV